MALLYTTQKNVRWMIGYGLYMCLSLLCLSMDGCSDKGKPIGVSAADLAVTNEVLAKEPQVRLDREDFSGSHRATTLLHVSVSAHYQRPYVIGSTDSLEGAMGNLSRWLQGKEKNEAVLRQLCQDPQFKFEGNKWAVIFNVLRSDGGVDEWSVAGEYNPQSRTSRIENMEGRQVEPKGTFSYPLAGG